MHLGDVGEFAAITRAPDLRPVGGVDKFGAYPQFVAALGDPANQHRGYLQGFAHLLGIVFFSFELEYRASCHDLHVGKLRQRTDQALGQPVAEIFVVRIVGSVDEGKDCDRADSFRA